MGASTRSIRVGALLVAAAVLTLSSPTLRAQAPGDIQKAIDAAVVSPPLDDAGNSVRAQKAIADISNALGGNPYARK